VIDVDTATGRWDAFAGRILDFLRQDVTDLVVDGTPVRGFRSPDSPALWVRDHSDILRAGRYVLEDVTSAVDAFAASQHASGRVYDYVTTASEAGEPENWEKWVRVPVEADVEYRFVVAAHLAWQATGDRAWLESVLPALDRALNYTRTHPWRWNEKTGLVKRPYTIDTWDFDYTAGRLDRLNFQVTDDTFWGHFHGDQSGFYTAARRLAALHRAAGSEDRAVHWASEAAGLRERANERLFNGRFYTHFDAITPVSIEGVDEAEQLSLSNPMAANRGLATGAMARAIVDEYRRRGEATDAFAEWFSIDPPFPAGTFGDDKLVPGAYVNGGIMPLVGGELARAALENGREAYGVRTLAQYRDRIEETGETYLWYFPDGTPSSPETSTSPEAQPTDGWGSSAMLYAFVEGLCGVVDRGHSFEEVRLAPRWAAAGEDAASVDLAYAASGAGFGYRYDHDPGEQAVELRFAADASVDLHLLLPEGARARRVARNGEPVAHEAAHAGESAYVDARLDVTPDTVLRIEYDRA
jgi:hypothetical protein